MKQIIVDENQAGQRLDKLLMKILNKAPKSFIYKMLRKKNIVLNGRKAQGNEIVRPEDEIRMYISDETMGKFSAWNDIILDKYELDIVYEDSNILIINKPAGMLSQKSTANDISVVEHIIAYLISQDKITREQLKTFKPSVCNRLDRNTSGLIISGKTLAGLQEMAKLLRERKLDKYYLCIVKGRITEKKEITGYLFKDKETNKAVISQDQDEDSDYIATRYEPLAYTDEYTLLQVKLITGKSHQIRAHLASIGHPIVGDHKYGDKEVNSIFARKYRLKHQLLHCFRYVFPHLEGPLSDLSGKEITAPEPEIFRRIRKDLFPE